MALDFRASQVRTNKLISSGSNGTNAKLLVYDYAAASNDSGGIDTAKFPLTAIGSDVFTFFSGGISSRGVAGSYGVVAFGGDTVHSGSAIFILGITGSLTNLVDGTPYLISGPNISITTQSNGAVAISGTINSSIVPDISATYLLVSATSSLPNERTIATGSGISFSDAGAGGKFNIGANFQAGLNISITTGSANQLLIGNLTGTIFVVSDSVGYTTSSVSFDTGTRYPTSIGTDVFFFVSGSTTKKAVFGGDVIVSGTLTARGGLSGSLTRLTDGTSYLRAGPGITINSSSVNGAVTITGSGGTYGRLFIGSYTTTVNTSSNPQVCGQNNWRPTEFSFVSGSSSVFLQAILSALTGSATAFVRLYNVTSGAYVHIGGSGITELSTSQTTPTKLLSVNLSGATNFNITTEKIYEVQIYTSTTASTTFLGSAELLTQV